MPQKVPGICPSPARLDGPVPACDQAGSGQSDEAQMKRILLSEDEPVLARNIARALAGEGVHLVHAPTAAATRAALAAGRFDLVIIDISLGDGNGLSVIGEAAECLAQVPVIVMTGQDSVASRARAEELTVAAFLAKPFALSRLRELAAALLNEAGPPVGRPRSGPSVVMYSHDTIGLGHMRRNSAIAARLAAQVPGLSVLMLVGCAAGMMFDPVPGVDYVKLPSLAKLGRHRFQAGSLRLDAATTRAMRMGVIDGVIGAFRPDLFLVDHEPLGAMGELRPVLERLRDDGRTRTVLGLRDILDEPGRLRAAWAAAGTDRAITSLYDRVLVYGDAGFFPTAAAYGLDALLPGRVTPCGIVTTARRGRTRPAGQGAPRRVVVSGGGGRDAFPLIEAAIGAVSRLPRRGRPQVTVVTGPLMDSELQDEAEGRARAAGIDLRRHVADFPALLSEADLLITMTGYNTINEALAVGCPIVTVPRLGPSAEQRMRAEALAAHGLARHLDREALSAEALARLMRTPPPVPRALPDLDGVTRAAGVLASLLRESDPQAGEEAPHARAL